MTHTETPWFAANCSMKPKDGDDGKRFWEIRSGESCKSPYADAESGFIECGGTFIAHVFGETREESTANAARIVHCVNTHDALVKALEGCIPSGVCLSNSNIPDDTIVPIDATMGELRAVAAALALAKGEGE